MARAAAKLGLRTGRDLDVVGWVPEESYSKYVASFTEGQVPAAVTWSMTSLVEAVMARLAERRRRPELPITRMIIATRLRLGAEGNGPVAIGKKGGKQ